MFAHEDRKSKPVRDPMAPAKRSDTAVKKVLSRALDDGSPVHSFQPLKRELATVVRNIWRTSKMLNMLLRFRSPQCQATSKSEHLS